MSQKHPKREHGEMHIRAGDAAPRRAQVLTWKRKGMRMVEGQTAQKVGLEVGAEALSSGQEDDSGPCAQKSNHWLVDVGLAISISPVT